MNNSSARITNTGCSTPRYFPLTAHRFASGSEAVYKSGKLRTKDGRVGRTATFRRNAADVLILTPASLPEDPLNCSGLEVARGINWENENDAFPALRTLTIRGRQQAKSLSRIVRIYDCVLKLRARKDSRFPQERYVKGNCSLREEK
ncbi:hypothetical protein Trydic_g12403 [Trypoxylus dichotomus]